MKLNSWTAGVAVFALLASPAFAQQNAEQWTYDGDVQPVGCDSCCDTDCGDSCGCGSSCGGGGLFSGTCLGAIEGLSLAGMIGMEGSGIDIGGWTQFGYHDSQTPTSVVRGDGLAFNDLSKTLNLHQQWFYVGKEADGSCGLGLGFRADFVYGTDAQKTQSFGNPAASFDNDASFDRGVYGWAIPQLYGEIAINDLSVKIGHFYTLIGYEVVTAPDNFFYSHALTMFNSEPFTHTGVLGTYSGFENMTLYGGWTLGWDTGFDNLNQGNSFLGGFSVGLSDCVTLTYINTYGNFGARDGGQDDSYSHSIVFDVTLTDNINYVVQSDLVAINSASGVTANDQAGLNQYLFYTYNDVLSFGTRLEWWKSDGVSQCEITSGVNIKMLDNLVLRPEFRKDWTPKGNFEQDVLGFDAVLTY